MSCTTPVVKKGGWLSREFCGGVLISLVLGFADAVQGSARRGFVRSFVSASLPSWNAFGDPTSFCLRVLKSGAWGAASEV